MNKFSNDKVSCTQLMMLSFLAMMSPFASSAVSDVATASGKAAFLSPAVSFGAVCLIALVYMGLLKNRREGQGLLEVSQRAAGKAAGRIFAGAYGVWMLLLAAMAMRYYGERFISSVYQGRTFFIYAVLMAGLVALAAGRRLCCLARAGQIFMAIIVLVLLGAYLLSLNNLQPLYVLPMSPREMAGALPGGFFLLEGVSVAFGTAFLAGRLQKSEKAPRTVVLWAALFALNAAILIFILTAGFSPELAARMRHPFMVLVRSFSLFRVLTRIDAAVVALWIFTDFCYIALACRVGAEALSGAFGIKESRRLAAPAAAAVLVLALAVPRVFFAGEGDKETVVLIDLILCAAAPFSLYLVGKIRKKI